MSFDSSFYQKNRSRLRSAAKINGPIVLASNGLLQKEADGSFPFQQNANFLYLTGIAYPEMVMVIDVDEEYLITPKLSSYQSIFDGVFTEKSLHEQSGIKQILDYKEGWRLLKSRLKEAKELGFIKPPSSYLNVYGMYTNPASASLYKKLKHINPGIKMIDVRQQCARIRMVKQDVEIEAIQSAIKLTGDALSIVRRNLASYNYEYEIEATITGRFIQNGAVDAWKPIVASGKNACILHSKENQSKLRKQDLVLIDIGAEVNHYCADITRTLSISRPNKRQLEVHKAVREVQDFAFSLQVPGNSIRENELKIEAFMGKKLMELKVIDAGSKSQIRKYYPHATSHFLGINPHDAGDYEEPLKPGTVLTVEPGIYIPEEGIGVRIEDDVLITDRGCVVMSKNLPAELF